MGYFSFIHRPKKTKKNSKDAVFSKQAGAKRKSVSDYNILQRKSDSSSIIATKNIDKLRIETIKSFRLDELLALRVMSRLIERTHVEHNGRYWQEIAKTVTREIEFKD